jgi:hypothetical protein
MKLLIILLTSILLSGCFWQTANHSDLQKAAYFCKGIENVEKIDVRFDSYEVVICLNGKTENTSTIIIPTESGQ